MRDLNILERMFAGTTRGFVRISEGYDMGKPVAESLVEVLGVRGFFDYATTISGVLTPLGQRYDPFTVQIAIAVSALFNGCRYCTLGHFYSANLLLFDAERVLGPIDEAELITLMAKRDDELLELMREAFSPSRYAATLDVIERLWGLGLEQREPVDADDELLAGLVHVWAWINECTIVDGVDLLPSEAKPLGAGKLAQATLDAYHAARAQAR